MSSIIIKQVKMVKRIRSNKFLLNAQRFNMIKLSESRRYVALGIVLLALVILASTLSKLKLKAGTLFSQNTIDELLLLLAQLDAYRRILLGCAALFPLLIIFFFFVKQSQYQQLPASRRNNMFAVLLQLIFLLLAFMVIRQRMLENGKEFLNPAQFDMPEFSANSDLDRIQIFIPQLWAFIAGFGFLSLAAFLVFRLLRRQPRRNDSLEMIKMEAISALNDIEAGLDLRNVILRCYYEMNQAVEKYRGLKRPDGMTPREFEHQLVHLGIPQEPVSQLTRLFEEVRYGGKEIEIETEEIARTCLNAIAIACK